MDIQQITVGPIVGATTPDSVRLFGRGELELSGGKPRRGHGIVRMRKTGDADFEPPHYFKLNPNFDMTGVAIISNLQANTKYEYQMGWLFSEVDTDSIDVGNSVVWDDIPIYIFKTASDDDTEGRTIVFGSCRYVLKLLGGNWFDDRGDKTFRSILRQHHDNAIDQLLMCGDQIYADDLNFLSADKSLDEYNSRYRKVFTTDNLQQLMSQVPTYMTLDDHEIEDNWPDKATSKDWVTKFPAAMHAYSTYQLSHSPLLPTVNNRLDDTPTHLWYSYKDGCCDVFVSDTRTERNLSKNAREILGPNQMNALLAWLADGSNRVKVIVTSVPFYEQESKDKWHGFISQRDQILGAIKDNNVSRVVILSGDVHASMSSELKLEGDDNFKIISVVSSAFFWPYPHPLRRHFKLEGELKTDSNNEYRIHNASDVYPKDAFVKLYITPDGVDVAFFKRKGRQIDDRSYTF